MAVFCSECGEKLLGAVNRCWNCGREFELLANEAIPPIRRAPIPHTPIPHTTSGEVVVAQPADDMTITNGANAAGSSPGGVAPEVRRGSPFAGTGEGIALRRPLPTQYPTDSAARGAALASVVVGVIALAASFFTAGGIVIGIVGLFMGVWGLYSDRRAAAIAGTVLSCIALAIACFHGAVYLYFFIYGINPFAPEIPEMDFSL